MNRQVVARNGFRYGAMAAAAGRFAFRNRAQLARGFGRAAGWAARRIQRAWRARTSSRVGAKRSRGGSLRGSQRRKSRRRSSAVNTSQVYNSGSHLTRIPPAILKSGIRGIAKIASRLHAPVTIKANRTYNVDCTSGRADRQISLCCTQGQLLTDRSAVSGLQATQGGYVNNCTRIAVGPYFETYQGVNNSTAPVKLKINVYRYKQDSSVTLDTMYSSTTDQTTTLSGYVNISYDDFNFDLLKGRVLARDNLRRVAKRAIVLSPGEQFRFSVGWAKQRILDVFKLEQATTSYLAGWTLAVEFVLTGAVAYESNVPSDTVISSSMGHVSIINSATTTLVAFEDNRRQTVTRTGGIAADSDVYGKLATSTNNDATSEGVEAFINPVTGASTVYSELR
nr:MAG: putative capsid protein [Arizlama virus]